MFCRSPSRPTRAENDEITGAGRPLRNTPSPPERLASVGTPSRPQPRRTRPAPILGAPRRQPAGTAVDTSTPTTHLDPP